MQQLFIEDNRRKHGKITRGVAEVFAWRCIYILGFPGDSVGQNSPANAGDTGDTSSVAGLGRLPGRSKWQPTLVFLPGQFHEQKSLVEPTVHGKSRT